MTGQDLLAEQFEAHRTRLRAVAYRMLGSVSEADDAVQEAWLRLSRTGADGIENLGGWLTTVVGRVSLDMLRSRAARREEPLDDHLPDPVVSSAHPVSPGSAAPGPVGPGSIGPGWGGPEQQAELADSIGLAMLVVLDTLTPRERVAFVLHDMFAVPFADISPIVGRSPGTTKMLASRARQRVQHAAPVYGTDRARQRKVVAAFLNAARGGDFDGLLAVLDPDVVLRADASALRPMTVIRGAAAVARGAVSYQRAGLEHVAAIVNGTEGFIALQDGQPVSVAAFTIRGGTIAAIDIVSDPQRVARLDLAFARLDLTFARPAGQRGHGAGGSR